METYTKQRPNLLLRTHELYPHLQILSISLGIYSCDGKGKEQTYRQKEYDGYSKGDAVRVLPLTYRAAPILINTAVMSLKKPRNALTNHGRSHDFSTVYPHNYTLKKKKPHRSDLSRIPGPTGA